MRQSGASSKLIAAFALVVGLLIGAGIAYSLVSPGSTKTTTTTVDQTTTQTVTSVSTSTVTSTVTPSQQAANVVESALADHLFQLGARNVSAIVGRYESNASVDWHGYTVGIGGIYTGTNDIDLLWSNFLRGVSSLIVGNEAPALAATSGDSVTLNSSFAFAGLSDYYGIFNGTVSAQYSYKYSSTSGAWLISEEDWNFTSYNVQFHEYG